MNKPAGVELVCPGWTAPANVKAGTTTRRGGVSVGACAGLNLAGHVGDAPESVAANRRLLYGHLGREVHWLRQVHGSRVVRFGRHGRDASPEADAWVCFQAGQVCGILTADCLPVFFCDLEGTRVGLAHAGWRGLLKGILASTVSALDCPPAKLIAWLGPAISAHAYQVGDEVRDAFISRRDEDAFAFMPDNTGTWRADLGALATSHLRRLGVSVSGCNHCTFYDRSRFYSYRRDGSGGRMASLVWLEA